MTYGKNSFKVIIQEKLNRWKYMAIDYKIKVPSESVVKTQSILKWGFSLPNLYFVQNVCFPF